MLHTLTPTTAVPVTHTEDLPPEIAEAVMAQAMAEPTPVKVVRLSQLSVTELYDRFERAAAAYEPDRKEGARLWAHLHETREASKAVVEAAAKAFPIAPELVVPNTNPPILGGYCEFSDWEPVDFTPEPTWKLTSLREVESYCRRNPEADEAALQIAFARWDLARYHAGRAAAPELVAAQEAADAHSDATSRLRCERNRLFDALTNKKADTLEEALMQVRAIARFSGGRVTRDGAARLESGLYDGDLAAIAVRLTEIDAKEKREQKPRVIGQIAA